MNDRYPTFAKLSRTTALMAVVVAGLLTEVAAQPTLIVPQPDAASAPAASSGQTPFNLHVVASEELLNRFVARSRVEPGEVDDFLFGAKVDGQQWTATQLSLDLRPAGDRAHAAFILDGHVQSQTTGRTEQGAVHSIGRQQFYAVKDVFFDGAQLSTRHAAVHVRTENQNVGASTPLDGTLFEGLGSRIALKVAERNRPQTEEYARNRVVQRVYPSFDKEVDEQLADANDRLEESLRSPLRKAKLLPSAQLARSSDTHLHYAGRFVVGEDQNLVAPAVPLIGPHGLTMYVHESLLNGLLDRLNLQGRKTTDRELRDLVTQLRTAIRGGTDDRDADDRPEPAVKLETEIEFDATQPLAVRFVGNRMELELRATFRPAGQALLPPLAITVPLRLERRPSDEWTLVYGDIDIRPMNGDEIPSLAKTLIRQAIQSDLPAVSFPATLTTDDWPADKPRLKVAELQSADGWLVVSLDGVEPAVPPSAPQPLALPGVATPVRARPR
ncbi:MAG: hypothetical protein SH850_23715 [Planctomycetaceae bacterium]|nr:hypothetical protein [Planctomycetaceae bacterium]